MYSWDTGQENVSDTIVVSSLDLHEYSSCDWFVKTSNVIQQSI